MWERTGVGTFKVYLQQRSSKVTWNYTWTLTLRRWSIYWPGLNLEENTQYFIVLRFLSLSLYFYLVSILLVVTLIQCFDTEIFMLTIKSRKFLKFQLIRRCQDEINWLEYNTDRSVCFSVSRVTRILKLIKKQAFWSAML